MLDNSYRRKPENPIKHIVASWIVARDLLFRASTAMLFIISAVTGAFLVAGLDSIEWTNTSAVGDANPAME